MDAQDLKIMVVEDDEYTRAIVLRMLEGCNARQLITAENGKVALRKLENTVPEIIICDWNMPEMSGLELLRKIRSTPS